eukprot:6934533-Prymnesium_polylepis.2
MTEGREEAESYARLRAQAHLSSGEGLRFRVTRPPERSDVTPPPWGPRTAQGSGSSSRLSDGLCPRLVPLGRSPARASAGSPPTVCRPALLRVRCTVRSLAPVRCAARRPRWRRGRRRSRSSGAPRRGCSTTGDSSTLLWALAKRRALTRSRWARWAKCEPSPQSHTQSGVAAACPVSPVPGRGWDVGRARPPRNGSRGGTVTVPCFRGLSTARAAFGCGARHRGQGKGHLRSARALGAPSGTRAHRGRRPCSVARRGVHHHLLLRNRCIAHSQRSEASRASRAFCVPFPQQSPPHSAALHSPHHTRRTALARAVCGCCGVIGLRVQLLQTCRVAFPHSAVPTQSFLCCPAPLMLWTAST